jgi:hypothetical protein
MNNIHIHIERLILDGMPVNGSDGSVVQAAIEGELAHLLTAQGLPGASPGAMPYLSGGRIQLVRDSTPSYLGHQIAQAIHTGFAPAQATPRPLTTRGASSA